MNDKTYRCSACELKKPAHNICWKPWDGKKPDDDLLVGICRDCNAAMKQEGFTGVKQYLKKRSAA
jgi:hypothetical protein